MTIARIAALAIAGVGISYAGASLVDEFPSRPVRIIVPFPPGGGADALARIMQPSLTKIWGQPVIIENKPGASGHIGADFVAASEPDGYMLMMSSTASLTEKNVDRFAPVTLVSASPYVVVSNPKVPARNVRELIDYAKKNPGKLSFGSSGTGAASHLSAELFKSMAGVDMLHVPYKGTGQAVTDLLAGQIDLMFAPAQTVMPQVQAGRLNALAVTSARRSSLMPDLPTVAESGVPNFDVRVWFGVFLPAGTPRAIVMLLNERIRKIVEAPDVRQRLIEQGADPVTDTPEEFGAYVKVELARWTKVVKDTGARIE